MAVHDDGSLEGLEHLLKLLQVLCLQNEVRWELELLSLLLHAVLLVVLQHWFQHELYPELERVGVSVSLIFMSSFVRYEPNGWEGFD